VADAILLARVNKFGLAAALGKKCGRGSTPVAELRDYYVVRSSVPAPAVPAPKKTDDSNKGKKKGKGKKDKKKSNVAEEAPLGLVKVPSAVASELDAVRSRVEECVDESGKLCFNSIFSTPDLPVKLEICSGGGEWAVKQVTDQPTDIRKQH
jgi:hypothetical protein